MSGVDILRDLVGFDTIRDKENAKILDYIENYLKKLGFSLEKRDKYLVMSYGKTQKLCFIGHSDTVEYIDGWDTLPHKLTQKENMLYGLGACDMKGGIAAFLEALSEINLMDLKSGIKVIITYDEEISFSGIKDVVKDKIEIPDYIIVGEPTENKIMTACKGLFAVNLYTRGIKVHSSTPAKGKNAINSMIKLLTELEDYYNQNIRVEENDIFEVPYTTMNIGLINGGSAINSVAANCSSYVDFRTINERHTELLNNKIKELCAKYDARVEIDIDVKSFSNDLEFVTEKNSAGFMTEASFIKGKRAILGVGPMTAHEVNEHISIESLKQCVKQYRKIIENICK